MTPERAPIYLHQAARVAIRRITDQDKAEFTRLAEASSELFRPWIIVPTTADEFDAYLGRFDQRTAEGLMVCIRETGAIAGFININEIIRGPYLRGTLGYGAFAPTVRQGYMYEGMGLVLRFAFDDLGLHRLEADIQPDNTASLKLVDKLRFTNEGYSCGFVRINGTWRDHQRWAITSDMIRN
jgi:ribosomal-protein-alanine N-acetyltransferase